MKWLKKIIDLDNSQQAYCCVISIKLTWQMLSFSLQIDAAHPPSGAAEDSKKVQFSLDIAPQPIVTRIKNPNEFGICKEGPHQIT